MRRCGAGSFVEEKSMLGLSSRCHPGPSSVFKKLSKSKSFNTSLVSRPLKSRLKGLSSCAKRGQYSNRTMSLYALHLHCHLLHLRWTERMWTARMTWRPKLGLSFLLQPRNGRPSKRLPLGDG